MTHKRRCTAHARSGHPCRAWAMRDSDPPRCRAHRGKETVQDAEKVLAGPAFYPQDPTAITIDAAIAGLADKMRRLDAIIASRDEVESCTWPPDEALLQLFGLYSQASSRLSRLLRDRRALSGEAADGFAGAVAQALDELSSQWGVEL